ncbi:MAG: hypothetical protein LBQ66_13080 [Planctomycetaceae bacterium]|jgi:hypothetical protein|nr:hypothetical protein [Planctomycetaceae bacterium]
MIQILQNQPVPKWIEFVGISNIYFFAKQKRILKHRDPWEVFALWHTINIDIVKVGVISNIFADIGHWPNSLFIPDDKIMVMMADYEGTFAEFCIWQELELIVFKKKCQLDFAQLKPMSYIEFLRKICLL